MQTTSSYVVNTKQNTFFLTVKQHCQNIPGNLPVSAVQMMHAQRRIMKSRNGEYCHYEEQAN